MPSLLSPIALPPDLHALAAPDLDPDQFASSVLERCPAAAGALPDALARLNAAIDQLTRSIRSQLARHHLALLANAAAIANARPPLHHALHRLALLRSNLARLHAAIAAPHAALSAALVRLDRYQHAAELARRLVRFLAPANRLAAHVALLEATPNHPLLPDAALSLAELEKLLDSSSHPSEHALLDAELSPPPSLRSLRAVQPHISAIVAARKRVEGEMAKMFADGLFSLDRSVLASAFQTAFNLAILHRSVSSLVLDLTQVVRSRIRHTFDLSSLAKAAGTADPSASSGFSYKYRSRTEPTAAALPHWNHTLWTRLGALVDDLTSCCVKVYTLEQVLEWRKDPVTGISFLDAVMAEGALLEKRPRAVFWTTLGDALEKEIRDGSRASNFIIQSLTAAYPRLLRLFHDFFAGIALHSHTTYTSKTQSPEMILTLKAVARLESAYLTRCTLKMTEASNGPRVENLTAAVMNELDAARFDPLLVRSVAQTIREVTEKYVKQIESRVATHCHPTMLSGPAAPQAQAVNVDLFNNLCYLSMSLSQMVVDYEEEVQGLIERSIAMANQAAHTIISPILAAIRRELSIMVAHMHGGVGGRGASSSSWSSSSPEGFMDEVRLKLQIVREGILARIQREDLREPMAREVVRHLLRSFLFQASLMSPLTEEVKLRLTGFLAELEFEVTQFFLSLATPIGSSTALAPATSSAVKNQTEPLCSEPNLESDGDLADDFEALRDFRQLLFLETVDEVEALVMNTKLDVLVVVHQLILRSGSAPSGPLSSTRGPSCCLPHQAHGWSQAEYARWVDEHPRRNERIEVVMKCLEEDKDGEGDGQNAGDGGWKEMAVRVCLREKEE